MPESNDDALNRQIVQDLVAAFEALDDADRMEFELPSMVRLFHVACLLDGDEKARVTARTWIENLRSETRL